MTLPARTWGTWGVPVAYRDDPPGREAGFTDADCLRWARFAFEHGNPSSRYVWSRKWVVSGGRAREDYRCHQLWGRCWRTEGRLRASYDAAMPPVWRMRAAFHRSGARSVVEWVTRDG